MQFHIFFCLLVAVAHSRSDHFAFHQGTDNALNVDYAINERHLTDIRFLTHSGTNAEAYWSFDSTKLSFQAIRYPYANIHPCDSIYTINADGSDIKPVSGPIGRTTCSFFYPDGERVLYSSTRSGGKYCPPAPDMSYGYLWPLNKDMDIYVQDLQNGTVLPLVSYPEAYTAEAVISPNGKRIIFTSTKDGDLELYTCDLEGKNVRRMTYTPGYDGGAWFSWDSSKITWRANRPRGSEYADYKNLLDFGLVSPVNMQIYWQEADLSAPAVQLTFNNGTNFAPAFLPDDSGIIFSSDLHAPNSGNFQLYTIKLDGTDLQQITGSGSFNSFPMFSPDGQRLAWESSRNTKSPGDINILVAKWV